MGDAAFRGSGRLRRLAKQWDVVGLLVVFGVLLAVGLGFEGTNGQYVLSFIVPTIVVLVAELAIQLLPPRHRERFESLVSGLAAEMEDGVRQESQEREADTAEAKSRRLAVIVGSLVGFFLLAYGIGYLLAIPLLVIALEYSLGEGDVRRSVLLTVVFVAVVYVLFGVLLNAPITDGQFIDLNL